MNYDESSVLKTALEYFRGDELASKVWMDKYALRNEDGNYLEIHPMQMFGRVASELSRIEGSYKNPILAEEILSMLTSHEVIPAGSGLFGIGNPYSLSSLGNCFVLPSAEDSYAGILQVDAEQVQIMKRRGGVGHDLSNLRPKGSKVNNAAKTSTGATSFMNRFSESTKEAAQLGRRGALMLTMHVDHDNILSFIKAKDDTTKLTGANISVKITDAFIERFVDNEPHAKEIWEALVYQSWKNGEPGVLFWDRIIEESPADCYNNYQTVSTNPCNELPLSAYDSCRLLSIILPSFVIHPFTDKAYFDFNKFSDVAYKAQKLMDDIIDLEAEKIDTILTKVISEKQPNDIEYSLWLNIRKSLSDGRRTGLGVLGFADMLAMCNISYNRNEAISLAYQMGKTLAIASYTSSIHMARDRGSFKLWSKHKEENNPFINRILQYLDPETVDIYEQYGRRNIANLAIAPTGSISMISQCSSGIEPVFNLSYTRRRKVDDNSPYKMYKDDEGIWWEEYKVVHPQLGRWMEISGCDDISESPYADSTANEIDPLHKVRIQGVMQQWIDHSISITYNLPEKTSAKEVGGLMLYAWESGCKGLTVYRDESRHGILINAPSFKQTDATKRPKLLECDIFMPVVQGEKYVVIVGKLEDKPYEVFAFRNGSVKIKEGYIKKVKKNTYDLLGPSNKEVCMEDITSVMSQAEEDRTRLISTALRHGTPIQYIVEQLYKSKSEITHFSKAIARTLNRYVENLNLGDTFCPQCKSKMIMEGGCSVCMQCGFSKCL